MKKQVFFESKAREKMLLGANILANAVKVTLGPLGRTVVINRGYGIPIATKDGVTIAREIEFKDLQQNTGALLLKEASAKTCDLAGDGTTTATVLAQALTNSCVEASEFNSPRKIKKELLEARDIAIKKIESLSRQISGNDIEYIATISANDSELGKIIAKAYQEIGVNGVLTVEESGGTSIDVKTVLGMQFDRGFASPFFAKDKDRQETIFENSHILITGEKIESSSQIIPLLKELGHADIRKICIIADEIRGEALEFLVNHNRMGTFEIIAINAPFFAEKKLEFLEDIASITGGIVCKRESGIPIEQATVAYLGRAKKIIVTAQTTTIVDGAINQEKVDDRVRSIKTLLSEATTEYDKLKLEERLARLSGGIGVIKVGGNTEAEVIETKHRIEDAVLAVKSAMKEGVVIGGGCAYILASRELPNTLGGNILKNALLSPFLQICENAHLKSDQYLHLITEKNGLDAANGIVCDMYETGILDPVLVTKNALQNAISCAITFMTCDCLVVPDENSVE